MALKRRLEIDDNLDNSPKRLKIDIPDNIQCLLIKRQEILKLIEIETNPFIKYILEHLETTYRIMANSLYAHHGYNYN
jgi:hypothetical protein